MKKSAAGPVPDKAYLQKIWDGWSTLDPANVEKFYATGPHVFFDIAPLKYGSWDEYQKGVKELLAGYKSAKFARSMMTSRFIRTAIWFGPPQP